MDLLALILTCSLHPDDALVRAVIDVQSAGHVYFVGDLSSLESNDSARDVEAARALLEKVRFRGHRAALGLLGVPPEWAVAFGRPVEALWDGCANISVGTARLSEYDYQCRAPDKKRRRRPTASSNRMCILKKFAAELALPTVFVGEVLSRAHRTGASVKTATTAAENGWGGP
jgi:hypothetical protein